MRPRPIIPSCTSHLLDVDSRSAAAALLQGRIVPGRLGAKQAPEAERLLGNRDLVAGIVDDLGPRRLPIVAVRGLARRRDETLALLAGRLRDQLLCPEPEPSVLLLDADLVAALAPPVSEPATQLVARVAVVAPACIGHPCRTVEQACDVDAHQRRRDDSERGKGGVAAADRRLTGKDVAKAAPAGGALEVRAR